eukprot:TRINITY_DN3457_c0_g1_i1.p1 TRINITY_DN3457_c0_g1~~TRINITY_DN3457_c0_g1_i1.p1  ORF type:complete len:227 (+),score=10.69 TRINITY_DN3457_c0_g1_i1:297-977(+)
MSEALNLMDTLQQFGLSEEIHQRISELDQHISEIGRREKALLELDVAEQGEKESLSSYFYRLIDYWGIATRGLGSLPNDLLIHSFLLGLKNRELAESTLLEVKKVPGVSVYKLRDISQRIELDLVKESSTGVIMRDDNLTFKRIPIVFQNTPEPHASGPIKSIADLHYESMTRKTIPTILGSKKKKKSDPFSKKIFKCYKCSDIGHSKKNCPLRKKKNTGDANIVL